MDNLYFSFSILDPNEADRVRKENYEGAKKAAYVACQKEVVLAKNHGGVLPMEKGKKVNSSLVGGVCGEHGGDPDSVKFCDTIGLDYVSCSPFRIPQAKLAAAQAVVESRKLVHA